MNPNEQQPMQAPAGPPQDPNMQPMPQQPQPQPGMPMQQPQATPPQPVQTPASMQPQQPQPVTPPQPYDPSAIPQPTQPAYDPNMPQQSQPAMAPQQPQVAPQPMQSQAPQVMPGMQPQQPIGTQPQGYPTSPMPSGGSKNKLFILIGAIVAGVLVLALGVWLLMSVVGGVTLRTYEGDGYTIQVPESFETEEAGTTVSFAAPSEDNDDYEESAIFVAKLPIGLMGGSASYLERVDEQAEDGLTSLGDEDEGSEMRNFVINKDNHNGKEARLMTMDVYEDGKLIGKSRSLIVIASEEEAYLVSVNIHSYHSNVFGSMGKITGSFTVKD